jgi:peptide/nickel transport system substrate-binding protein
MTRSSLLAVGFVLALAGAGCGSGDGGSDESVRYADGGTYTQMITSDPGNLHPLRAVQIVTNQVLPFAYDTLIGIDQNGRVTSQVAERWKATPKRVTFTLRPDVTCSDGTKLKASDVAAVFEWVKVPKNQSSVIGNNLPSADYEVKADDAARTVTISMAQPFGFLLQGAGTVPILCPKGLANPKSVARATDGTGPFKLVDSVADDHLTFEARPEYKWGPGGKTNSDPGVPDEVVFRVIQNQSTATNLLLSGELNSADISGPDTARLKGRGFQEVEVLSGPYDLFFNQREGHPGADPKVRQALATALDLEQLMKVITEGEGERPTSLSLLAPRPCRIDTVEGQMPKRDLEAAKALLDEAGWTAGPDGKRAKDGQPLTITLTFLVGEPAYDAAMELVRSWWGDLGVDVKLESRDANAYTEALFAGNDWDVAGLNLMTTFPSVTTPFVSGPASPEGQNFSAIQNDEYDRLAQQAAGTVGQEGCEVWAQSEQALFRNFDVVPVAAQVLATYAKGARVAAGLNGIEPTSVRMLAR